MRRVKRNPLGRLDNLPNVTETEKPEKRKLESCNSADKTEETTESLEQANQGLKDENGIQYAADGPLRSRRRLEDTGMADVIPSSSSLGEENEDSFSKSMLSTSSANIFRDDLAQEQSNFAPIKIEKKMARQSRTAKMVNCSEYCQNFFDKLYLAQLHSSFSFINRLSDINNKMRAILMDWIIEVHYKFRLLPTSLWYAITITDRYLNQRRIIRQDLQLLGTAALMIAVKLDESREISPEDYITVTDHAYTVEALIDMEANVGSLLNFEFYTPTVGCFLMRYNLLTNSSDMLASISNYYAERCVLEHEMMKYPLYLIAAACIYASRVCIELNSLDTDNLVSRDGYFPLVLESETGLDVNIVKRTAMDVMIYVRHEGITISHRLLNAVRKKYAGVRGGNILELDIPVIVN